jgi:drug/metabolite transporter (DMT)-like permease
MSALLVTRRSNRLSSRVMSPRQTSLLLTHAAVWGAAYIFIAGALTSFTLLQIVGARTVLAALLLSALARHDRNPSIGPFTLLRQRPLPALSLTLANCVLPFLLITFGERAVPANLTGILMGSIPLWTAAMTFKLDPAHRISSRREVTGIAIGLVGVILVVGFKADTGAGELLGVAAVLIGACGYALSSFIVKRHFADVPPIQTSRMVFVLASAVLVPPLAIAPPASLSLGPTLDLIMLAAGSTALAFVLVYKLVDEIGPQRASLSSYLAPGFSVILGALVLGESITTSAVVGLLLIVAGVATTSRRPRTPASPRTRIPLPVPPTLTPVLENEL